MSSYIRQREEYYYEVIRLYSEERMTPYQISKILPPSEKTIRRWITKFAGENFIDHSRAAIMDKQKEISSQHDAMKAMEAELQQLRKDKVRLESDLRRAEMKADLYNEIINVAEKQFNIPIRKKAGAKQ